MKKTPKPSSTFCGINKLYIFILLILLSETTAMSFLKEYSLSHEVQNLAAGIGFYMLVSFFLVQSFHYTGMGVVNVLWSAFSIILVVTTGVVFFGEHVSVSEIIGVLFVIVGVICVRWREMTSGMKGGRCLHIIASDLQKN